MTALQTFRLLAPEFASIPDEDVQGLLTLIEDEVPESRWGKWTAKGRALLAAHTASLARPELAEGGVVASQSAGGVSVSYAASAGDAGELSSSRHGVEFARLRRTVGLGGMII